MANLFQAKITEAVLFHKEGRCVHNRYGRQEVDGVIEKPFDGCHEDAESSRSCGLDDENFRVQGGKDGHEVCEKISFSRTADAVFRHFIDVQAPFPLLEDLDIDIRFANFIFKMTKSTSRRVSVIWRIKEVFPAPRNPDTIRTFMMASWMKKEGPIPSPLLLIISK